MGTSCRAARNSSRDMRGYRTAEGAEKKCFRGIDEGGDGGRLPARFYPFN